MTKPITTEEAATARIECDVLFGEVATLLDYWNGSIEFRASVTLEPRMLLPGPVAVRFPDGNFYRPIRRRKYRDTDNFRLTFNHGGRGVDVDLPPDFGVWVPGWSASDKFNDRFVSDYVPSGVDMNPVSISLPNAERSREGG